VEFATIRSPIDGRAGARLVDVGNLVHPADVTGLVLLTQIQPVIVSFALPQALLPVLRAQQARAALRVVALTQDASNTLDQGELTLIDNQIDATTGTIRCKATFSNAKEALWPGQFVTARILLGTIHDAVVVPGRRGSGRRRGPIVYVVGDGIARIVAWSRARKATARWSSPTSVRGESVLWKASSDRGRGRISVK